MSMKAVIGAMVASVWQSRYLDGSQKKLSPCYGSFMEYSLEVCLIIKDRGRKLRSKGQKEAMEGGGRKEKKRRKGKIWTLS